MPTYIPTCTPNASLSSVVGLKVNVKSTMLHAVVNEVKKII